MKPVAFLFLAFLSSCTPVRPWEKEYLAHPLMTQEPSPLTQQIRLHTFESREGAKGGYGIGGGGCGCN